jgi:hypothetical protein
MLGLPCAMLLLLVVLDLSSAASAQPRPAART